MLMYFYLNKPFHFLSFIGLEKEKERIPVRFLKELLWDQKRIVLTGTFSCLCLDFCLKVTLLFLMDVYIWQCLELFQPNQCSVAPQANTSSVYIYVHVL